MGRECCDPGERLGPPGPVGWPKAMEGAQASGHHGEVGSA